MFSQEQGSVFVSLDGNFGLVHKTKRGTGYDKAKLASAAFLPEEDVDRYLETHDNTTRRSRTTVSKRINVIGKSKTSLVRR